MKFLIFFAVAAVFGSVYCDQECFRAVFKECARDDVPMDRMTLCDEIKFQTECIYRKAYKCKMPFWIDALSLLSGIKLDCTLKDHFEKDKACFANAAMDPVCNKQISEAMTGIKTTEDFIRANKKVCNLFDPYSNCVKGIVEKNCHNTALSTELFNAVFEPHLRLSNSLCDQLVLPADEKDSRPDNFGVINVYTSALTLFA